MIIGETLTGILLEIDSDTCHVLCENISLTQKKNHSYSSPTEKEVLINYQLSININSIDASRDRIRD
jgi:hypothetical protein